MVDAHDAHDAAQEAASKLLSKGSRWRTKIFSNNDAAPKQPAVKPAQSFKLDDDVNAFLKPSTDKAQQQRDATAAFLSSASRPRIDIARAQRWPGAQDVIDSAATGGRSPGPGGLKTSTRRKGLTVSFVRTVPDVIGHGGDECEEPASEVSRRKQSRNGAGADKTALPKLQEEGGVTGGIGRSRSHTEQRQPEQRTTLTRTMTSRGELSPPLDRKLEMGRINSIAQTAPPPPPQRVGTMGLGERPRPLARAPTGFDTVQPDDGRRPSHDSGHSQDSDNMSPVLSKKIAHVEPTIQEEDNFQPKPLLRTQTGFHTHGEETDDERPAVPAISTAPRLPEMRFVEQDDDSPLDANAILAQRFLQNDPPEASSFAARVTQRMRAEEGKAFHDALQRQGLRRDSDSSSLRSLEPPRVGSPPSAYHTPQPFGRTPPLPSPNEPPRASPLRSLELDDPQRSRAQGLSPGRRPMPPGSLPLDTDPRPVSSSSSQFNIPSAASQARTSPAMRSEPFSATTVSSIQQTPSTMEKAPFSAVSYHSIPPNPLPFEQEASYFSPAQSTLPPLPPVHGQNLKTQVSPLSHERPVRSQHDREEKPTAPLARSDTRSLGETAFKDFAERVTHMRGIFQLTAQLRGQLYDRSPMQWLRVATWWFLKGRTGMESYIRNRPKTAEVQPERLTQSHVDLAKVLWIITEVLPNHPRLQQYHGPTPDAQAEGARQAGDIAIAEAYEIQSAILHYIKLLVGSMKKHESMPPTQALIQGQDQSIWEEYPSFAPDAASILQAGVPKFSSMAANGEVRPALGLSQYIPLADTKSSFCYFRMFGKASLSTDDPTTDRVLMPIVVSILRSTDQYQVKLAICSQSDLVNIIVGSGLEGAPAWSDVNWKKKSNQISVQLRHSFILTIELSESEFRSLWAIVDHTNRVQMDLRERKDERYACKLQLREAIYKDPANPSAFPPERVLRCKLMVFEKIDRSSEGTGKRKLHRGYRMALVTSQQNKQVSLVNHEVGTKQAPMSFEYITEADQAPAMKLHFREGTADSKPRVCTVHLVFTEGKERNHLFGTFTSMNIVEGEMAFAQVPLKSLHIESADQAEGFSQQGSRVLEKLQWQEAKVVNQDPEAAGLEAAPTVMSESLRIVCRHTAGIVSDRMNLGMTSIFLAKLE
jgi:hypothetical protein